MKNNKRIFNTISTVITLFCFISLSLFSYFAYKVNIIPTKYLILIYIMFVPAILLISWIVFHTKKKSIGIIGLFIIFITSLGFSFITLYLNNTYHFFKGFNSEYDSLNYSVIVLKDSYKTIEDLKDKEITYLADDYNSDIKTELNKKITYNKKIVSEFGMLPDKLKNKETDAIVIEDGYLSIIYEEDETFEKETTVIYTFTIKVKSHKEESTVNLLEEPFILYISGIDQYGNVNSVRGRSDVNQLAIVNPKTHHILLVNTPRDYYIQLAGTTGLRDKLTHAGIYGIDKSIDTLENLYDLDISNYLRVNFDTLIKVIDVIGGIDIYSDKSFVPWTNRNVYVNKGWNHFNGEQALAYSRERKTYIDGDHHRGRNQQQVITAIIDKVSKSNVLISKYNSILSALDGSFQTDIEMSTITSFIKYQLDKMPTWNVESIAVTGSASWNYTYSMGYNYYLWVMEPDYNSVKEAKNKIYEVLYE